MVNKTDRIYDIAGIITVQSIWHILTHILIFFTEGTTIICILYIWGKEWFSALPKVLREAIYNSC